MNQIEKIYQKDPSNQDGYVIYDNLCLSDAVVENVNDNGRHPILLTSFWNNYKEFSENVELMHTSNSTPTNPRIRIWAQTNIGDISSNNNPWNVLYKVAATNNTNG